MDCFTSVNYSNILNQIIKRAWEQECWTCPSKSDLTSIFLKVISIRHSGEEEGSPVGQFSWPYIIASYAYHHNFCWFNISLIAEAPGLTSFWIWLVVCFFNCNKIRDTQEEFSLKVLLKPPKQQILQKYVGFTWEKKTMSKHAQIGLNQPTPTEPKIRTQKPCAPRRMYGRAWKRPGFARRCERGVLLPSCGHSLPLPPWGKTPGKTSREAHFHRET